jgi:HEAT repeat protein
MESRERDNVLADLAHADEELRRLAVERLTMFAPIDSIPHLIDSLGDSSWRVRKAAIDRLASSPELSRAVEALVNALRDGENPGRRNAALEALVRTGAAALPVLLEATSDPDVDVRKQVVDVLAGIGDAAAGSRVCEMLEDADPNVRAAAADAIGAIGLDEALANLLAVIADDPEPLVQLSALRALARMETSFDVADVAEALEEPLLRAGALAALGNSEDPAAFSTLMKALERPARSARESAMRSLLAHAQRVEASDADDFGDRLRAAWTGSERFLSDAVMRLEEGPLETRLALVQFLGLLRDPQVFAAIAMAAQDEALADAVLGVLESYGEALEAQVEGCWAELPSATRALACQALAGTHGSEGASRLLQSLASSDARVRTAALRALGVRGDASVLPDLVARLALVSEEEGDEDGEGRALADAIVQLAEMDDPEAGEHAIDLLGERLAESSEDFRLAAAFVIGRVGRLCDVPSIELLLSDPSARVRRLATEALAHVAPDVIEPLRVAMADESATVRIGAAAVLAESSRPDVISDLAHLAADEDAKVRAAALRAVGGWVASQADDAANESALSLLSVGLHRGGVAAMASLESLARIGGAGVVPLVRGALEDKDAEIVEAALTCIGQHGTKEDLQELAGLCSHEEWTVRAHAVQVLAERRVVQSIPVLLRCMDTERDEFVRAALLAAIGRLESQAG